MLNCCGLISAQRDPVPLKGVDVDVEVSDHVATVASVLRYENKEERPLEAVFVFPLPGDAAVCHFSAKIGQTEVVAVVKEKQEAREEYDEALSSGQQAFLLEESEQSPDVFSMSVGGLPPGESASIRLEYVIELAVEADDGLRFCLPAVLNPRYKPQGSEWVSGWSPGQPQVTSVPASLVPYSLSFSARVTSPRPVSKVESNCSLDPLQYLNAEQTQATVRLAAGHTFDRDVELLIYYKDAHQPTAVVEAGQEAGQAGSLMGDPVVMLSLYPEFPEAVMSSVTSSCWEFLFLMDRSGSMHASMHDGWHGHGYRIGSARDTMLLLLKSLPMGCYFNIYGFGSGFDHIFPQSVEYKQDTMQEAVRKVKTMEADMGGTEILQPLNHIYKQPCIPGHPRQLFVFTDGEVSNTKAVIDLVKRNAGSHRCFTFGIGEGASSALITGMAKQGGGHGQFITGAERMQPKVMQSLRFALQPAVVDISVSWDLPKGVSVTPLSPPITALFQGQRSLIYAQLTGESSSASEGSVKVKYRLSEQPVNYQLLFGLKPTEGTRRLTVHRLGARALIRSLELEQRDQPPWQQDGALKKRVVDLSVQSGVSSAFTAFIAVTKGSGEAVQGPLIRRNVPVARFPVIGCKHRSSREIDRNISRYAPEKQSRMLFCHPQGSPVKIARSQERWYAMPPSTSGLASPDWHHAIPPSMSGLASPDWHHAIPPSMSGFSGLASPKAKSWFPQLFSHQPKDNAAIDSASPFRHGCVDAYEPEPDTLLQLVSLQQASGSWTLTSTLVEDVLGKSKDQVEKSMPAQVSQEVWTTVLALIWLHGFKTDTQDEWQLLAMKAVSWVRAQTVPNLVECMEAGNTLLGCKVLRDALGL